MKSKRLTLAKETIANLSLRQLNVVNGGTRLACNWIIETTSCIPNPKETVWCSVVTCFVPGGSLDTQEGLTQVVNPSYTTGTFKIQTSQFQQNWRRTWRP